MIVTIKSIVRHTSGISMIAVAQPLNNDRHKFLFLQFATKLQQKPAKITIFCKKLQFIDNVYYFLNLFIGFCILPIQ